MVHQRGRAKDMACFPAFCSLGGGITSFYSFIFLQTFCKLRLNHGLFLPFFFRPSTIPASLGLIQLSGNTSASVSAFGSSQAIETEAEVLSLASVHHSSSSVDDSSIQTPRRGPSSSTSKKRVCPLSKQKNPSGFRREPQSSLLLRVLRDTHRRCERSQLLQLQPNQIPEPDCRSGAPDPSRLSKSGPTIRRRDSTGCRDPSQTDFPQGLLY
jgi:hypothetical protein